MNHTSWISQKIYDFCDYLGGDSLKNKVGYLTNVSALKLTSYGLLQRVGLHVDSIVTDGRATSVFRVSGLI